MSGAGSQLRPDFTHSKVLGFDIRIGLSGLAKLQSGPRNRWDGRWVCKLTLDPELWPSLIERNEAGDEPQLNGYNLYFDLPDQLQRYVRSDNESAFHVAFDIPGSEYAGLQETFGWGWSQQNATSQQLFDAGWVLLGYDVIDPRTQQSGLHSFDFLPEELAKIDAIAGAATSVFGLLVQSQRAEQCATLINSMVPDHAPFCPCGVWFATVNGSVDKDRRSS